MTRPFLYVALLAPCLGVACSGGGGGEPLLVTPVDPLMATSTGVERILRFSHPSCGSHSGVDALRLPRLDTRANEMRDDWLFVASGATGVYGALVDDDWQVRAERYWPVAGLGVVWSDVCATRIADVHGRERAYVYFSSRGTNQIEISDVTDFPNVVTVSWPIDIGLPVTVRGVHTMRIDAQRGVMVLNAVDVVANPLPAPLTPGCSPAVFFDVKTDPMRPRLLSVYVGPDAGDQTLFDSHFLEVDGQPIWAATIQQPQRGNQSYFAFYDGSDPAHMDTAQRLAIYAGPATGTFHNVVSLPPAPDGTPRLAAGFEAFAFQAPNGTLISKAAVLDASDLATGRMPTLVGWLADANNQRHAVHNPASRLLELGAHTYDTVPLAHFTGGYFVYRCSDDQNSVRMLAHVPVSATTPAATNGHFHANMTVATWPAVYNGAWDVVGSPIGDFVSSTDQEASYLIEPTHGLVRQYGTFRARADGVVPRIRVLTGVPEVGAPLELEVTGLEAGGTATLLVGKRIVRLPPRSGDLGPLYVDRATIVDEQEVAVTGTSARFTIPSVPALQQLVFVAYERTATSVLKAPAAVVHVLPATLRSQGEAVDWVVPDHIEHEGGCCGLK